MALDRLRHGTQFIRSLPERLWLYVKRLLNLMTGQLKRFRHRIVRLGEKGKSIFKDYFEIIGLAVAALLVFFVGYDRQFVGNLEWSETLANIADAFYANGVSELASIIITVVVIQRWNTRRQNAQELTRLKALLGSNENVVTKIATAELNARGWLTDGSLKQAFLPGANLQGAFLGRSYLQPSSYSIINLLHDDPRRRVRTVRMYGPSLQEKNIKSANLQGADLRGANLQRAQLDHVNLQGTKLQGANLRHANLFGADLQGADLMKAHLQGADLNEAKLRGANLMAANIEGADLGKIDLRNANVFGIECDETTILPNGEKCSPESQVDWSQFGAVEFADWYKWQAYQREHGLIDGDGKSSGWDMRR